MLGAVKPKSAFDEFTKHASPVGICYSGTAVRRISTPIDFGTISTARLVRFYLFVLIYIHVFFFVSISRNIGNIEWEGWRKVRSCHLSTVTQWDKQTSIIFILCSNDVKVTVWPTQTLSHTNVAHLFVRCFLILLRFYTSEGRESG